MSALPDLPERQRARQGNGQTRTSRSGHQHSSTSGFSSSGQGSTQSPLSVNFGNVNNLMRLRKKFEYIKLDSRLPIRLAGQIGADLNLQQQAFTPAVTLQYEIVKDDKYWGLLQADTAGVSYRRPITVSKRDLSCKFVPKVGYSWQGRPEVGADLTSLKPKWAVVAVGLGMLASGRRVGGNLRLPDHSSLTLNLPGVKVPGLVQGEVGVSLQRTKHGVSLNIGQVNGILSL